MRQAGKVAVLALGFLDIGTEHDRQPGDIARDGRATPRRALAAIGGRDGVIALIDHDGPRAFARQADGILDRDAGFFTAKISGALAGRRAGAGG